MVKALTVRQALLEVLLVKVVLEDVVGVTPDSVAVVNLMVAEVVIMVVVLVKPLMLLVKPLVKAQFALSGVPLVLVAHRHSLQPTWGHN
jgi:hypothetical protein